MNREHHSAHASATADEQLQTALNSHGFALERAEPLPELDGVAYRLTHAPSGAQLLYLRNADTDRAFAISFKTPPANDTGVFHILEHSVLCGSSKFPVKEPFVNLLKTSMQTFLNAMTFPDKTMYPVASTNEADLLHLMDVYLDAVFHPAIYEKETTFAQEGWHMEVAERDGRPELVYNGVVFSEMKGALSEPDAVLWDALSEALFPNTAYGYESGGRPAAIVDLTYEEFLATHRRHYRPDNAQIVLYGALDIERVLAFLDEEYLTPLACEQAAAPDEGPNVLAYQEPVVALNRSVEMATAPENAEAGLAYVIGTAADRLRVVAADILFDAIMGSNEAPMKRAILEAGIGDEVSSSTGDSILQPFTAIILKGSGPDGAAELAAIVEREARRLADGALDHELIEASLSHSEFLLREHDLGLSDGVAYAIAAMASWLYDREDPCSYLRYEDVFAELRRRMDEGYFERLLRELVLENPHRASVNLVPVTISDQDELALALERETEVMGEAGLEAVAEATERLREAQEAPDSPEALATLPMLTLDDLGPGPDDPLWLLDENTAVPTLRHAIETHGILYANRYFSLPTLTAEELPLLSILGMVLGKLDTARHSAAELDTLIQMLLGAMSFYPDVVEDARGSMDYELLFAASASALSANARAATALVAEILAETDFSDLEKIRRILIQRKVGFEQMLIGAGHSVATRRAYSYCVDAFAARERLEGFAFYEYLVDLLAHFDERGPALSVALASLAARIATDSEAVYSLTGDDEAVEGFWTADAAGAVQPAAPKTLPWNFAGVAGLAAPGEPGEAIAVPADVAFLGLAYDRRLLNVGPSGLWSVASRVLSYDYLWNEIRVKGGAYGCGFSASRDGELGFYTYRDPHIDESAARIAEAGAWLGRFDPPAAEMDGYIISTTAGFDAPVKPRALIRRKDGEFLSGYDPALRRLRRSEVLEATSEGLRALGRDVTAVADARQICCVGNRELLESSALPWRIIEPFAQS